jgi:hypothetical protein
MNGRNGAACWLTIHDDLLRGMTHALSNRVGTILAAVSLADLDGGPQRQALETLHTEAERLDTLLRTLRQLPRRVDGAAEPLLPTDAAQVAIELHSHHPEGRERPCQIVLEGDPAPAYADPTSLALAIAAALTGGKRLAGPHGGTQVAISSTDELVCFDVRADAPTDGHDAAETVESLRNDAAAAAWLLGAEDDRVQIHAAGIQLLVPTLGAARRARKR